MRRLCLALVVLGIAGASFPARAQEGEKSPTRTTVSLQAEGEPLLSVLKRLCLSHGYNFVADQAALERGGTVSLSLTNVSFEDALEAICDACGLEGKIRGLDAHPIVIVRLKTGEGSDPRPRGGTDERTAVTRPAGNRFLEGLGGSGQRPTPPAPLPSPAAPSAAPVSTQTPAVAVAPAPVPAAPAPAPSSPPAGAGAIVVGLVVEVSNEGLQLKETSGDPRAFVVPPADTDALRNERIVRGLSHLKKGDRVCLEYRSENGKLVILNLVGGGKPAENP